MKKASIAKQLLLGADKLILDYMIDAMREHVFNNITKNVIERVITPGMTYFYFEDGSMIVQTEKSLNAISSRLQTLL